MAHPGDLDAALARLARALRLRLFLRELTRWVGVGLLAGGCAILLARVAFELDAARAVYLLLPLAAAPLAAARRARSGTPERSELAAWLDRRAGGSGALVTALEVRDPLWKERLEAPLDAVWAVERGRVRTPWRSLAARLLPALAFAALAVCVPLPEPRAVPGGGRLAARLADELRDQLQALSETVTLEERIVEELETRMARLEEGSGEAGESFLEAADALAERIGALARRAGAEAESVRAALERARRQDPVAGAEGTARALAQAADDLRASGLERLLPEGLKGLESPAGIELDARALADLSAELSEALAARLEALRAAGWLDPSRPRRPEDLRRLSDPPARQSTCGDSCGRGAACTGQGDGACAGPEGEGSRGRTPEGSRAGVGGSGRGPGPAELQWGAETPEHRAAFRSEALPAARVPDPADSTPLGIGIAAPELDVERGAVVPQAVEAALGEAAWGRRVAPRHRRTIERWFAPPTGRDGH